MERGLVTDIYTQDEHDQAAMVGGKILVASIVVAVLALLMAVIA